MLSERINDELTLVDGDLNDLNVRREKLIDGRSRAIVAEGGLAYLNKTTGVKNRDEKEDEFNLVLDDLTDGLFAEPEEQKVVDISNEEKQIEVEEPKKKKKSFSTGE